MFNYLIMSSKKKSYKIVLLGDTAVGKSCVASRFVNNQFYEFQEPTIGAAFLTKTMEYNEKKFRFEIWDTAGQERYRSLAPMYYRGSAAAIIVYDITQNDSLNGAITWVKEVKKRAAHAEIILVGNKKDLEVNKKVDYDNVKEIAEQNNITHLLVSAKTGENINLIFEKICELLPEDVVKLNDEINNIIIREKTVKSKCC